ncbi:hypothetical protein YC2023_052694 [Brassica napus]
MCCFLTQITLVASSSQVCTIPLDTAKVRLQLQKSAIAGDVTLPKYRGLLVPLQGKKAFAHYGKVLYRDCIVSASVEVKNLYVGKDHVGDVPLSKKILAGLTTGALGIIVANPTDLVKVRLQAEGKLAAGVPKRYTGALNAYSTIVRQVVIMLSWKLRLCVSLLKALLQICLIWLWQEGVRALWTGLGPNVARNAIINAAELASYDQVKQTILKIPGFTDNVVTHILSGLGAGFFAVCIGSPVDVVKSRMMGDSAYKNTIDCFVQTLQSDGPMAFYKGFIPNFGRLGSWNVIMFLTLEQVKMTNATFSVSNQSHKALILSSIISVLNTLIQAKKYVRELESSKK